MKSLSRWAAAHPWTARWLIVAGHLLLVVLALFIGRQLDQLGWQAPVWSLYLLTGIFAVVFLTYPSALQRKKAGSRIGYRWHKGADFSLLVVGFLMTIGMATHPKDLPALPGTLYAAVNTVPTIEKKEKPTAEEILASMKDRDRKSLSRQEKRILKKEFRAQVKNYVKAKVHGDREGSNKALKIILACIAALGLLAILAIISCSIACSGAEAAAAAVFILGLIGIIFLFFGVLRSIKQGPRKKRPIQEAPKEQPV